MKEVLFFDNQPMRAEALIRRVNENGQLVANGFHNTLDEKAVSPGKITVVSDCFPTLELFKFLEDIRGRGAVVYISAAKDDNQLMAMVRRGVVCQALWSFQGEQILSVIQTAAKGGTTLPKWPESESVSGFDGLTPREIQVTDSVADGLKNKEIAEALGITAGTVKVHLMHIFEKVGCRDRYELARERQAQRLQKPPEPSQASTL